MFVDVLAQAAGQGAWSRQVSDLSTCVSVRLLSYPQHAPPEETLQTLPLHSLERLGLAVCPGMLRAVLILGRIYVIFLPKSTCYTAPRSAASMIFSSLREGTGAL